MNKETAPRNFHSRMIHARNMSDPVVELQSGLIRGVIEKHEDGFDYYAFKGIPYGELPVGDLRFQDPVRIKKWTGTIDCKEYGPACLQFNPFFEFTSYSENSLHLNIFTHSINDKSAKSPVMVVIYGGGFIFGSPDDYLYGPDYLIRKNVVVMTVGYRIGALGFLNLEDELVPGNQGLKDLLMALQWVQQNIRVFGGDPENVTLFGPGSGGVLIHYLTLSPLSRGLISKVIMHTCTAYNIIGRINKPKLNAIKLCSILEKDLVDSKEILEFLKTVDAESLLKAQETLRLSMDDLPFGPGTDSHSPNPVMAVDIEIAANQGIHLPCILGYTSHEGGLLLMRISREQFFEKCNVDFGSLLKLNTKDLIRRYDLNETQLKKLYYKGETISEKNTDKFVDCISDIYFVEGMHRSIRVQSERSSAATYIFVFSYNPPELLSKIVSPYPTPGPYHFDELPFLFKMRALQSLGGTHWKKGTRQYRMMEQMVEMYTNFARYGRPTLGIGELTPVHWLPNNDGTVIRYLDLDEDITMKFGLNLDKKLASAKNIQI